MGGLSVGVRRLALAHVVLGLVLAEACTDSPSGPSPAAPGLSLLGGLVPGDEVAVVERTSPLLQDETGSATIGPLGGVLTLPAAGLSVVVPAGSVLVPTTITVVAPAGGLVGYHFYPEGRVFLVPLLAVQDLSVTRAAGLGAGALTAAYFAGDLAPVVEALEVIPLAIDGVAGAFEIHHFSGYVVATN